MDGVDQVHVELNLCPSCDSFVKTNWPACRSCGHELGTPVNRNESETLVASVAAPCEVAHHQPSTTLPEPLFATPADDVEQSNAVDAPFESELVDDSAADDGADDDSVHDDTVDDDSVLDDDESDVGHDEWPVAMDWWSQNNWSSSAPVATGATQAQGPEPEAVESEVEEPAAMESEAPVAEPETEPEAEPVAEPEDLNHYDDVERQSLFDPVEMSYQQFNLAPSPTAQTVADLRSKSEQVEPIDPKWIMGLVIGGAITLPLIIALWVGSLMGHETKPEKDQLISLGQTTVPKNETTVPAPTAPEANNAPEATGWVAFTAQDNKFNIEFPSQPSVQSTGTPDHRIVWQATDFDSKSVAVVMVQDAPAGTHDDALNSAVKSDAAAINAKLGSRSVTTQNGRRQISAHLSGADNHSIDLTAFIQGGTLYTVLVDSPDPNGDPDLFGHLLKTFQVPLR